MNTEQVNRTNIAQNMADGERLQQLVTRVSWASQRFMSRQLEEFGLTLPQWMTLRNLAHLTRPGCTLNELCEVSHQVPATMTGIINRLVQRYLVDRQRDPENRRALRLSLTPQGLSLISEIERIQNQHFEEMLSKFSQQERQLLIRMMNHYMEVILEEIDPKKPEKTGIS